jgi:hypothetical protein
VFQIGGAGAVGTDSVRGTPHLLTLAKAGFSIWPFDPPHHLMVIEIYPRALVKERVNKGLEADPEYMLEGRIWTPR